MTESTGVLPVGAVITYLPGGTSPGRSLKVNANYVFITMSGWLRVTWTDGKTTLVSPAAVWEVSGKGVEYA